MGEKFISVFLAVIVLALIAGCAQPPAAPEPSPPPSSETPSTPQPAPYQTPSVSETPTPSPESAPSGPPSLSVASPKPGESVVGPSVSLQLAIENFDLVAPGGANKANQGHVRVLLDNVLETIGVSETIVLESVSPTTHKALIELRNNDGTSLSPAVVQTLSFAVLEKAGGMSSEKLPSVQILSPKPSQVVHGTAVDVVVEATNFLLVEPGTAPRDGEGYFQVTLDSSKVLTGKSPNFKFEGVSAGQHSLRVELLKANGSFLSTSAFHEVSFESKASTIQEFNIEADDVGYYGAGNTKLSVIDAFKGNTILLNVLVRSQGTYFNGLKFTSEPKHFEPFNSVATGETARIEFVATESFKVRSWWPSTDAHKADLDVRVS